MELLPEFAPPSDKTSPETLENLKLLGNHALQLIVSKPQKIRDYNDLLQQSYQLLVELTRRSELEPLLHECITFTRKTLCKTDPEFAHAAIEFISQYHFR